MSNVRAVIFDYGGVVCFHPTEAQIAEAAEACQVAPGDFVRALWKRRLAYDGGMEPLDYWNDVARLLDREFDEAMIARMIEFEVGFWSRLDDRVMEWMRELRSDGRRLGILSNLPRPLGQRLRARDGFLNHFDHVTFSYELRLVKPQREIYEDAVLGLGVAAQEALFLDDRPENVAGAHDAGLQAELFVNWEQFAGETPRRYGLPAAAVARRQ